MSPKLFSVVGALLTALIPTAAGAVNLGVFGKTFPVAEPDIRAVIQAQVSKVDWAEKASSLQEKADNFMSTLPVFQLGIAESDHVRYFEPLHKQKKSVSVPVKEGGGGWSWKEMGQPGTVFNILDYSRPVTAFLIIDGRSVEQLSFAQEVVAKEPFRIVPVLSAGNPKELGVQYGMSLFYLTDWMHDYFGIRNTPSLVFPGADDHRRELGVAEFSSPYQVAKVLSLWPN